MCQASGLPSIQGSKPDTASLHRSTHGADPGEVDEVIAIGQESRMSVAVLFSRRVELGDRGWRPALLGDLQDSAVVNRRIQDRLILIPCSTLGYRRFADCDGGPTCCQDLLDLAVEQDVVDKSGSWYSYSGERIGQGRENVKTFLKENPDNAGAWTKLGNLFFQCHAVAQMPDTLFDRQLCILE